MSTVLSSLVTFCQRDKKIQSNKKNPWATWLFAWKNEYLHPAWLPQTKIIWSGLLSSHYDQTQIQKLRKVLLGWNPGCRDAATACSWARVAAPGHREQGQPSGQDVHNNHSTSWGDSWTPCAGTGRALGTAMPPEMHGKLAGGIKWSRGDLDMQRRFPFNPFFVSHYLQPAPSTTTRIWVY